MASKLKTISESINENSAKKWHELKMRRKQADKEKRDKEKVELDKITLTHRELVSILKQIKENGRKYDFLGNQDVARKLQKLGFLRAATTIEKNSSFGQMYYLTARGEKLLTKSEE